MTFIRSIIGALGEFNTTDGICGAETAYHSGAPEFTSGF
jgi:hypothetical protein